MYSLLLVFEQKVYKTYQGYTHTADLFMIVYFPLYTFSFYSTFVFTYIAYILEK